MVHQKGIDTPMAGRSVRLCAILAIASLVPIGGCSSFGKRPRNLVEIQLREQRTENSELRRELQSAQTALAKTQHKLSMARQTKSDTGSTVTLTSGVSGTPRSIERLELSSLLSGGLDRDGIPGDELLSVLATTVSKSGSAMQTDGTLTVTAFDYSFPAENQKVGHWEWDVEGTATLWSDGVVGTGYRLTKEWDQIPMSGKIVLHARFVSIDGQQFDATKTVTIDVPSHGTDAI
jgi:hypothetical protein